MNPTLLAQAIVGIPGSKTVSDFQTRCKISSYTTAVELLNYLDIVGVGHFSNVGVSFSFEDKLKLTLLTIQRGCDLGLLSSLLSWKDFEQFTTFILKQMKYSCKTNIYLLNPRSQIDVVAIHNGVALIIDCKHWRQMSSNTMMECADKQCNRARTYMKSQKSLRVGIPLIVTLHDVPYRVMNKVPFVSINRFRSFLINFLSYMDSLYQITGTDGLLDCTPRDGNLENE